MNHDPSIEDLKALRSFVVDCADFRALERALGRFNIFETLKIADHEIRHSSVLAWLLEPNEGHGLGDLFLRRWLMRVLHDADSYSGDAPDAVEIDAAKFHGVLVRREWSHIDLLVELRLMDGQTWAIAIENKVWSSQHSNQLARYKDVLKAAYPNARLCYVFLTVVEEEPEDGAYISATYSQVADVLDVCLSERKGLVADGPRLIIEHYQQILRSRFMENSEVAALARKIYAAHPRALDVLFEHRPDNLLILTNEVEKRLIAAAQIRKIRPMLTTKGLIRFIPESWNKSNNLEGPTWATFMCEITTWAKQPTFKAFVGPRLPGPLREELNRVAKDGAFPNTVNKVKVPQQWFTFYAVKGPEMKLSELTPDEIPSVAEEVWKWCDQQLLADRFSKMVLGAEGVLVKLPSPESNATEPAVQETGRST